MKMQPVFGRTIDVSGSGLQVRLPNPIPCGSQVKIETDHLVMLGEVCRCEHDGAGYVVSLTNLQSDPTSRSAS